MGSWAGPTGAVVWLVGEGGGGGSLEEEVEVGGVAEKAVVRCTSYGVCGSIDMTALAYSLASGLPWKWC